MEHQSLIRDRLEAKKKHLEAIEALQRKIEERENANKDPNEKEIVEVDMETYFNSMNFETNKIYLFRDKYGREYRHET